MLEEPDIIFIHSFLIQYRSLARMLKNIYKTPPIISYRRGKSLKDILVRAKL